MSENNNEEVTEKKAVTEEVTTDDVTTKDVTIKDVTIYGPSNDETKTKKTSLIAIEAVVAVTAVGVIGYALFASNNANKNNTVSDNSTVSYNNVVVDTSADTGSVTETTGTTEAAVIDNSAYYNMPALPDISSINEFTEDECIAKSEDGSLMKIEYNDYYVYVPNLDDIDAIKETAACTDEEIDDLIYSDLLQYNLVDAPSDKTVCELHDTVNIDYAGYLNGEAFDGGTATGQELALGSGSFIEGFEEQVVGMKIGETKDINVTFPESYGAEELAGKDATFTITLNSIVSVPAELTDELVAENFTDIKTVEECRKYYADIIAKDNIYYYLTSCYYVSAINEDVVAANYNTTIDYYSNMCESYYSVGIDYMLEVSETSPETFMNDVVLASAKSAASTALYDAVADYYNVSVTDERIGEAALLYGYSDENGNPDKDSFIAAYGEQSIMDYLTSEVVLEHIISLIK